jgi:hypothetical protein
MRICFLLGSGISKPAGLPSVEKLTEQVLSPKDFFRHSTGVYVRMPPESQPGFAPVDIRAREMERIEQLLRWLKGQAEVRYATDTGRSVIYEDLAYLAAQIHEDSVDEYDNPALGPLICCALNALPELCCDSGAERAKLGDLAEETANYIADVVADMLAASPALLEHLRPFREALADARFDEVNLFTLNHDCLLERFLRSEGVDVVDGFDKENSLGIRHWKPVLLDCSGPHATRPAVRLFKLHGSIDWRRFRPKEPQISDGPANPWREEYVGIRSNPRLVHTKDELGRVHEEFDRARFLAGTFNKMLHYLNQVFLELHYRFHRTLAEAPRLVVCGYGFGDKGINNRIVDWMCESPGATGRRLVLIDPLSSEQIQHTARGAIAGKLPTWKAEGRVTHLELPLGSPKITWGRIADTLLVP